MSDVLFEVKHRVGLITLNRPEKLNALSLSMCEQMDAQLQAWALDDAIKAVVIQGSGDRAFCAGGDVATIYHNGHKKSAQSYHFFDTEYTLNARIFHYPKPYIALLHGICMGGGLGVSMHGKFRIADPDAQLAMPETGIGFFPDVGASYFLSRCPGEVGIYLGLTGERIGPDDAHYCGWVDCKLARDQFDEFLLFLAEFKVDISSLIQTSSQQFNPAPIAEHRPIIDRCFGYDRIEDIFSALEQVNSEWTNHVLETLHKKSPASLVLTLNQLRKAKSLDFDQCIQRERSMVKAVLAQNDFYEGVRAMVIDKDYAPNWQDASVLFEAL